MPVRRRGGVRRGEILRGEILRGEILRGAVRLGQWERRGSTHLARSG